MALREKTAGRSMGRFFLPRRSHCAALLSPRRIALPDAALQGALKCGSSDSRLNRQHIKKARPHSSADVLFVCALQCRNSPNRPPLFGLSARDALLTARTS